MNMRNVILPLSFVAGTGAAMIVGGCGSSATHEGNWFTVQTLQDTVVLSTFGGNIESLPRSTSITAQWLNDSAGASGNVRVFGPVFTSFRGLYSQNDARLPAFWRVQWT